ncbi:histidine kinase [Pseudomonas syringae pv. aptata]|uniref:Histidine kinase, HAMP region: chemotaxis sensory transducer n=1 Tax=Pseudomonas syringae pv. japonica str. M301072 TaxID=629262 RepID=F3FMP5_PSESX|nr:histidine kinase, HAMP region: chemotaxis sensory transducer [Pseudomonas syringae]EGH31481.1 histidine kinase, HAMP region: chemotaxis sensory transducer [Pseudomonas syringae pv. japonica str. M301072]MCK0545277.1 histidine kinase [Pseudomonas syringae pv. aptata]OBS38479.1 histidine kinase [Pseudomonas syringae pv. syringae]PBP63952.1 histidine kinase [Pseudomonas syringae]
MAVRTRTSTDEIALLINELQTSTDHMGQVLEQNLALTDSSVELSTQASEVLQSITASVHEIEVMNEQIAVATEQQTNVGEEIVRGVTNVRDISDQTAGAAGDEPHRGVGRFACHVIFSFTRGTDACDRA